MFLYIKHVQITLYERNKFNFFLHAYTFVKKKTKTRLSVSLSVLIFSLKKNVFFSFFRLFAMQTWFIERHNFTYGSDRNFLHVIGHYTQMVNAATHKVGCGLTRCKSGGPRGKPFYNYVCNYCPM